MTGASRILLAATLRWPLAARLAIAFRKQGCAVEAWCPAGHPLERTRAVGRIHRGGALAPLSSLRAAIEGAAPDVVVPCDDDAALHLHHLHAGLRAGGGAQALRALIERSLGTPASCETATARGALMSLAAGAGLRIPDGAPLATSADLDAWIKRRGLPAVLKADRSWGGRGVTVVRTIGEARAAWQRAMRPSAGRALSHLLLRRDASYLLRGLRGDRPALTVQALVPGRPANRAVACWQGEVLGGISVVALQTRTATGPTTVARVIENDEMAGAATRLVRALGLSGFCGFDFILDPAGAAWLLEVNPRATPICHLSSGTGPDLPAALLARLRGAPAPPPRPVSGDGTIALFPGEWDRNPLSAHLRTAFHDVPWEEAELVRDCVAAPWEDRGLVARLRAWLYPTRPPRPAFPPAPASPPVRSLLP